MATGHCVSRVTDVVVVAAAAAAATAAAVVANPVCTYSVTTTR